MNTRSNRRARGDRGSREFEGNDQPCADYCWWRPRRRHEGRPKNELLADFSHEIRPRLSGILGHCELLLREEGARLTPHGRPDLHMIKANARTLLSLINDILDLESEPQLAAIPVVLMSTGEERARA